MKILKKIIIILSLLIIGLVLYSINENQAADTNNSINGFNTNFAKDYKSIYGIYKAKGDPTFDQNNFNNKLRVWVDSYVPQYINNTNSNNYKFYDNWENEQIIDNDYYYPYWGLIGGRGFICFGHENEYASGKSNKSILVVDIRGKEIIINGKKLETGKKGDFVYSPQYLTNGVIQDGNKKLSRTYGQFYQLAYHILLENKNDSMNHTEGQKQYNLHEIIRKFCFECGLVGGQYFTKSDAHSDAIVPSANNYAEGLSNEDNFKTNSRENDSGRGIFTKEINSVDYAFIGPYSIETHGGKITKATIIDKNNNTKSTEKFSINGSNILTENELKNLNGVYNKFYIVIEKNQVTNVKKIVLKKEYNDNLVVARIVLSQAKGNANGELGQDNALYGAYETPRTDEIDLPGIRETTLKIKKVDNSSGNVIAGVKFKVKNNDGTYIVKNNTTNGYEIRYTNNENDATIFTTDSNGIIEIEHLTKYGTYKFIEIYNPQYGYLELKEDGTARGDKDYLVKDVESGTPNHVEIDNIKETGNLIIEKIDADVNTKKLVGVTFTIKGGLENSNKGKYVKIIDAKSNEGFNSSNNTCTGTVHIKNMIFVDSENEATKFITDGNGLIKIYNILKGNYDVEEKSVGNNPLYEIDENYISWNYVSFQPDNEGNYIRTEEKNMDKSKVASQIWIHRRDSRNTAENIDINNLTDTPYDELTFKNKRKYINLSGYVWEDDYFGKQTQKDDLFNDREKLLNEITVRLMRRGVSNPIMTTTTSALNRYEQEKNQPDGEYLFEKVPLYDENDSIKNINNTILNEYYIEFEYNGVIYQNVNPHIDVDNGSKAAEKISERTEFNNQFAAVEGKEIDKPTEGTATSTSGSKIDLYYNEESTEEGKGRKMKWDSSRTFVPMYSRTNETGYNIKDKFVLNNGDYPKEIRNINLGLYEREQPDLSIVSDIESARATVKGYEYIYTKNKKTTDSNYNQEKANYDNSQNEYDDNLKHQFDLATSFGLKYGPEEYTGQLYASDIGYSESTQNNDKLNMYVKYKIRLLNTSTNLYSRVNEIVSYFDNRYETIESISESDGTEYTKNVDYIIDEGYNKDGYKKVVITKQQDIAKQSEKYLNITFKLSDEAIKAILGNDIMLNEVTEITSYTTYSDRYNTLYAGIDKDSNPGNADPADKKTYEDDTDFAPSFKITIREREITGTVWEDSVISNNEDGVKGNGEYDENENVLQNVKVELLEIIENSDGQVTYKPAILYKYDEDSNKVYDKDNIINTSQEGEYEFSGILPGKYVIRYTYGDIGEEKSIICDLNGNKIEFNPDDYKSTIYRGGEQTEDDLNWYAKETSANNNSKRLSDARDSDEVVDYRIKDDTEIFYQVATEKSNELTSIDAYTNNFEVGIDYDGVENKKIEENKRLIRICFDQVDFGITRRAEQNLKVSKTISWVELVLANGQTIISGNPQNEEIKHLKLLPDGNISIELDNELIQGSNLTVKYDVKADTNGTEIDYLDEEYYIYGEVPADKNKIRKVNVTKLYDYPVNDFVYDPNNELNSDWQIAEISEDQKEVYFSEDAYKEIKKYNTVLFTEKFNEIEPNEEKIVTLQLSKVLANNDDISLDNGVEVNVLKGTKLDSIPGNYVPGMVYTEEKEFDSDNAYISVTAPTGRTDTKKEIAIMAVSLLIILGTGIIFIKKKLLKQI